MLEAVPRSFLSKVVQLRADGQLITELHASSWREKAEFKFDNRRYELFREGFLTGDFVLKTAGVVLAHARKLSIISDDFSVHVRGRPYILRSHSFWNRRFDLFDGARPIGTIHRPRFFARRTEIELPAEWPPPAQIFVLWLVLVIWNREGGGG